MSTWQKMHAQTFRWTQIEVYLHTQLLQPFISFPVTLFLLFIACCQFLSYQVLALNPTSYICSFWRPRYKVRC